jgi:hypothetical protein
MDFDAVRITFADRAAKTVPCDRIETDEGWALIRKGEVVVALVAAQHVLIIELLHEGRSVGEARVEP